MSLANVRASLELALTHLSAIENLQGASEAIADIPGMAGWLSDAETHSQAAHNALVGLRGDLEDTLVHIHNGEVFNGVSLPDGSVGSIRLNTFGQTITGVSIV